MRFNEFLSQVVSESVNEGVSTMGELQAFNVATVIRVLATDAEDAQATVNAFLQRDDGELDDGSAIVEWRFPVEPFQVPGIEPELAGLGGSMSVPGIPDGEVGRNIQKEGVR